MHILLFVAVVLLVLLLLRKRELLEAAYDEGRRAGIKSSAEVAKERADVAVLVAPKGMLLEGLGRAQTASQIERDIRDLLRR